MLTKLIICRVSSEQRDRFSRGQTQWSCVSSCPGFRGQFGGWVADDDTLAVIVGLWADRGAYDAFMRDVHDVVFDGNGQQGTYDSIDVSLWDSALSIPGSVPSLSDAIGAASAVRLARCRVRPERVEHFVSVQRDVWNPGMAGAGGMLSGMFHTKHDGENEFLVCTLWQDLEAHRAYRAGVFTDLRRRTEVDRDCAHLEGWVVSLEDAWRVGAHA